MDGSGRGQVVKTRSEWPEKQSFHNRTSDFLILRFCSSVSCLLFIRCGTAFANSYADLNFNLRTTEDQAMRTRWVPACALVTALGLAFLAEKAWADWRCRAEAPPIRYEERCEIRYRTEYRTAYRDVQRTVYRTVPET